MPGHVAQWLIRVVENLLSITRMGDTQAHITKQLSSREAVLGEAVRKIPQAISWNRAV
jgi:two-component system sensor histidine kinase KdpD